ncbi:NRAMP family divalent metal transporter [Candidatus Laterigemmans baculatus]|uniref:NRAMP family divalent metal transporter n=1 Tax=Candidatus Laterigemmans baculatus TaxID=2770505 RepID=UPI0013DB5D80|nr:divalent metal cation transporter [Candidatus Laterigemmans baculatus]
MEDAPDTPPGTTAPTAADAKSGGFLSSLLRIGPAVVVAAVVLGPGSIVGASRIGTQYGYQLLWVVPVAGLLMVSMTIASMAIGVLGRVTPTQAVAERFGRLAAVVVGGMVMIAVTLFQASNNNALLMALEGFGFGVAGETPTLGSQLLRCLSLLVVNLLVIGLLMAGRRDLYRNVERAMAVLVGMMVLAFAINLVAAKPTLSGIGGGLVPKVAESTGGEGLAWLAVGALIATTFSVAAAYYQSYQVREKGWTGRDLRLGITDSAIGIGTLTVVTMMILVTAAAALFGKIPVSELTDAAAVARALEPLFGSWARIVFSVGIMAGAVSSFVVNAMVGGVIFSDSIGTGTAMNSTGVRIWTVAALLFGWMVASAAILTGVDLVSFIIVAQALTVFALPVLAGVLVWQLHSLPQTKELRVPMWVTPMCWIGLLVVVGMAIRTAMQLIERFSS